MMLKKWSRLLIAVFLTAAAGCTDSSLSIPPSSEQSSATSFESSEVISESSEQSSGSSLKSSEIASSGTQPTIINSYYRNPIYNVDFPDPSVIYDPGTNLYYAYATNRFILYSEDLVNWTQTITRVFPSSPTWGTSGAGVWAPDVQYINGQYVYYYSLSTWGDPNPGIGVATAANPGGPWTDRGELFRSLQIGVNNSIDPMVFTAQDGKVYMIWGSMRGNFIVEMTADGLSLKEGSPSQATITRVAGLATTTSWHVGTYEGAYVIYRDGYYYLFLSTGTCCEGLSSTYRVVVSRSTSPLGPYVDDQGRVMTQANVGKLILQSNNTFKGPGHNSLVTDAYGDTWMFYHSYSTSKPSSRVLLMDPVLWDENGWPYIENGSPSTTTRVGPGFFI